MLENVDQRKKLPTKEVIFAITDAKSLYEMRDAFEADQKKIIVDLEYSNRGEEWAHRARGALAAHDICLTNINRRIKQVTGSSERNVENEIAVKNAKANLKAAKLANIQAQAAVVKEAAEHKKIAYKNRLLNIAEAVSFEHNFYKIALSKLPSNLFEEIEKLALDRTQKKVLSIDNEATQ